MRLIDAEKLAEVLNRYLAAPHVQLRNSDISVGLRMGIKTCLTFLNNANTIEAEPVRHAKWVDNHCTACGMMPMGDEMWKNRDFEPPLFERFMDYCPSCGAKMGGGVDDADD